MNCFSHVALFNSPDFILLPPFTFKDGLAFKMKHKSNRGNVLMATTKLLLLRFVSDVLDQTERSLLLLSFYA